MTADVTISEVGYRSDYAPLFRILVGCKSHSFLTDPPPAILMPMIGLLQRVTHAEVRVETKTVGSIQAGLMVLVGVERGDTEQHADRLLGRLLTYRVFPDDEGRMNRSLQDTAGGLLLVSQFTLAADTYMEIGRASCRERV